MISDECLSPGEGILHHAEGIDLMPSNIELSGMEVTLVNTMSRETVLREYLNSIRDQYDEILLDCCPSLGMLTINALAAAEDIIIPCQAHFLSIKGMEQLIRTISNVKRKINPDFTISGILITMADMRTNYSPVDLLRRSVPVGRRNGVRRGTGPGGRAFGTVSLPEPSIPGARRRGHAGNG